MSNSAHQNQKDRSTDPLSAKKGPRKRMPSEDGVSLLDILLVLVRNRWVIAWTTLLIVFLGATYSLVVSEEYTSSAKVVRESQTETPNLGSIGGLGALRGLGLSIGGASGGLSPDAFPNVLQSREVRLAVARDTFAHFPDVERPMTFVEYVDQPQGPLATFLKYTVKLPLTIIRVLTNETDPASQRATSDMLTEAEDEAIEAISQMVSTNINPESGLMTISLTAADPNLAADMTNRFVYHLTRRIRQIRTEKVRERVQFVEDRFQDAGRELEAAEQELAQFLERNQNPTTASLEFQRDRLRRQVNFKEQLYSELQSQLTQTRLELQRRSPVATVVEKPVPPTEKSAPQRLLIVILSTILGVILGVAAGFVNEFIQRTEEDEEGQRKMREIQRSLSLPEGWR